MTLKSNIYQYFMVTGWLECKSISNNWFLFIVSPFILCMVLILLELIIILSVLTKKTLTSQIYFVPWYSSVYPLQAPFLPSLGLQRLSQLLPCTPIALFHVQYTHTCMQTGRCSAIKLAPGEQNKADAVNRTCGEESGKYVRGGLS